MPIESDEPGPYLAGGFEGDVLVKGVDGSNRTFWMPSSVITGDRDRLTADRTYYVANAPLGKNSNTGLTAGAPFETIQHAADVAHACDLNGYYMVIQLAAGTYPEEVVLHDGIVGGPGYNLLTTRDSITILGNDAAPSTVVVGNPAVPFYGSTFFVYGSGWCVSGIRIIPSGNLAGIIVTDHIRFRTTGQIEFEAPVGGAYAAIILGQQCHFHLYEADIFGVGAFWETFIDNGGGFFALHADNVIIHDTPTWGSFLWGGLAR